MSVSSNSNNNDPGKDYLSPAFFLLRKYVREKRVEVQRVEKEDGPKVDKNCFLMKLTSDTLQLLTDLDASITNFEIKLKSGHKKIDEKVKLINNQRALLHSHPNRFSSPNNNNHNTNGQHDMSPTLNFNHQPDRINAAPGRESNTYQRYLPEDITIEPVSRSNANIDRSRNQGMRPPMTNSSARVPFRGSPQPIVMRLAIPKNNSPNSNNTFRVIESTTRPFLENPSPPLPRPDLSLTQCPFCKNQRFFNIKATLMRHINEDHPEHLGVYNDIFSLTPESYVSNSNVISGTSQCFYCSVLFRSKAPLLRHIQEEHPDNYSVFETVANLKGLKLKNLITRPTVAQNTSPSRPDGLMIFNHVLSTPTMPCAPASVRPQLNPNSTATTAANYFPILPTLTQNPGHAAKIASSTISTISVQQRHPNHAAKSCQPGAIHSSSNAVQQPTKRIEPNESSASSTTTSSPTQKPSFSPLMVAMKPSPIKTPPLNDYPSRGRADHEYNPSTSGGGAVKRPAPADTKYSPHSPVRKTKKQQAEAIKSRYPCPKCSSSFSSTNALTLHLGFYCTARTQEEKAAVEGLKPCLPSTKSPTNAEGRVFIPPEKRDEVARAVSPALSRASVSSRASNGQALASNAASLDTIDEDKNEPHSDDEELKATIREFTIDLKEMSQAELVECMKSERTKKLLNLNCK